jgi:hypothetical protein
MKAYLSLIIVVTAFQFHAIAQSAKIVGLVFQQEANSEKRPVAAGASVFIPGVASAVTDDRGYYSIDLSSCRSCTPGATVRVCVNSPAGYAESEFVIPLGAGLHPFNITIHRNSMLALVGVVRNKRTGKFLKGIRVSALVQHSESNIPAAYTDEKGTFQLVIRRDGIANTQAIQVLLSDGAGKYKDHAETVFINQIEPVMIELEESGAGGQMTTLAVGRRLVSTIYVHKGEIVHIHAEGIMQLGNKVGNSGPGGIDGNKGVLGFSLIGYNIFPACNHGALLYRFGEGDAWKYYDYNSKNEYIVHSTGFIEFNINDNKQGDNVGAYTVTVTIRK